jgi:hypothetical protein
MPEFRRANSSVDGAVEGWTRQGDIGLGYEVPIGALFDAFLTRALAGTAPGKIWVAFEPQFEELLAGDLILIDHTRTFGSSPEIVNPPDRFDRQLVKRLRALDREEMTDRLSHLLSDVEIEAILDRRDALLAHLDQIIAERGEADALF